MTPDVLFTYANPLALIGWVALLFYPLAPRPIGLFSGFVLPVILSLGYLLMILVHWSSAEGGFDSLANVMLLFADPGAAFAGWLHFLAFDLFLGAWAAKTGREAGVHHLLIIPCLGLTFMFGPIGFLLTLLLIGLRRLSSATPEKV